MRYLLLVFSLLIWPVAPARAGVSVGIGIGLPGISIGINVPAYPALVPIPGYPVYYDPRIPANYFFYDGLYWVYWEDNWYASSWYNGPWQLVAPEFVPLFVLRVPVRYYRSPPPYFRGWRADRPPHWGEHWGRGWEEHRRGWDRWSRRSAPPAAPLPSYQREFSGDRYPRAAEQQHSIRSQNYRYQPRESVTRQHFQQGRPPAAPRPSAQPAPKAQPMPSPRQMQAPQAEPQHREQQREGRAHERERSDHREEHGRDDR